MIYHRSFACDFGDFFLMEKKKKKKLFRFVHFKGFPGGASPKEPACECRRYKSHGFDPWVGKIPWRRENYYIFITYAFEEIKIIYVS